MKRILVGSDLSASSIRVIDRAAMLATQQEAMLYVVHVVEPQSLQALEKSVESGRIARRAAPLDEVKTHLEKSVEPLRSLYPITVECEVIVGRAHLAIASAAASHAVDLVVVGAHRKVQAPESELGSTADRILRAGTSPTLVVRNKSVEPYREVLAAVDFSAASLGAMRLAVGIAPQGNVTVLHAVDNGWGDFAALLGAGEDDLSWHWSEVRTEALDRIERLLAELPKREARVLKIVEIGRPATVILERARAADIDLLTAGAHGASGVLAAAAGDVIRRIANRVHCDLLVVPGKEA